MASIGRPFVSAYRQIDIPYYDVLKLNYTNMAVGNERALVGTVKNTAPFAHLKLPAQLCYQRYHSSVLTKIKEIQHQNYFNHKLGMLIDIHGFLSSKKHAADIIVGTENGKTLEAASQLNIDIKWDSANGFLTWLKRKKYHTDPDEPGENNENPEFTGGITVENAAKQVNFIGLQFEAASKIRSVPSARKKLGKDVASSILKTLDLVKI